MLIFFLLCFAFPQLFFATFFTRIANGCFELNGLKCDLVKNHENLTLHGGIKNFTHRIWTAERVSPSEVFFTLTSVDGDQGFPGELNVVVHFKLKKEILDIEYEAKLTQSSSSSTVVNLTNHAYFNLNGARSGHSVANHALQIPQSIGVLELNSQLVPTGKLLKLTQHPLLDFAGHGESLGDRYSKDNSLFDCFYVINHQGLEATLNWNGEKQSTWRKFQTVAIAMSPLTGLVLQMSTDEPGFQLYTGKHVKVGSYAAYSGFCLEASRFPDACNHKNWLSQVHLLPGQVYKQRTSYELTRMDKSSFLNFAHGSAV